MDATDFDQCALKIIFGGGWPQAKPDTKLLGLHTPQCSRRCERDAGLSCVTSALSVPPAMAARYGSLERAATMEATPVRGPDADRHAKLLIHLAVEGSLFGASSQPRSRA